MGSYKLSTVKLSFKPIVYQVRIYVDKEPSIETPFDGIFTIQAIEDEAYISGYIGPPLTLSAGKELRKFLIEQGFKKGFWKKLDGRLVEVFE